MFRFGVGRGAATLCYRPLSIMSLPFFGNSGSRVSFSVRLGNVATRYSTACIRRWFSLSGFTFRQYVHLLSFVEMVQLKLPTPIKHYSACQGV